MPIYFKVGTRVFIFFKFFFITYLNLEIRIKFWPLFFIFFLYAIFVKCILLKLYK